MNRISWSDYDNFIIGTLKESDLNFFITKDTLVIEAESWDDIKYVSIRNREIKTIEDAKVVCEEFCFVNKLF